MAESPVAFENASADFEARMRILSAAVLSEAPQAANSRNPSPIAVMNAVAPPAKRRTPAIALDWAGNTIPMVCANNEKTPSPRIPPKP